MDNILKPIEDSFVIYYIHSKNIVNYFWHFYNKLKCKEIYNIEDGKENRRS